MKNMMDLRQICDKEGNHKYSSFSSEKGVRECMSELVETDVLGNYKDLIQGKLDGCVALIYNNSFDLPGNPVFCPKKGGEQTIVYDLDHPDLAFVKEIVCGLNPRTTLNNYFSFPIDDALYEKVKKAEGTFTLSARSIKELGNWIYSKYDQRMNLVRKLCKDDSKLFTYATYDSIYNQFINGFFPGYFEGMRFLRVYSIHESFNKHNPRMNTNFNLIDKDTSLLMKKV
jgi:hypothetical protein